ncbi:ZIP family metal transporter [Paucibacter sp. O1-1]|nr:ZIP family metal transporter [Paucibacter sp. O1-1]MDA3827551.1 ZIP family metal transporter [Paucibacter sp. O1-1]
MLVPPAPHLSGSAAARSRWRGRQLLGLLIVGAGLGLGLLQLWQGLAPSPAMRTALGAGGMAALATALGVLPMLCARAPGRRSHDALLGFGAGVMLAACCFSLLVPALAAAGRLGHGSWASAVGIGAALLAGAALIMGVERLLPHQHGGAGTAGEPRRERGLWLFVIAIVLHNIPEGLAIGVAAAGTDAARATALATGIAIQDVPEGLVVALALQSLGVGRWRGAGIGAASGLVEPLAAVVGAALLGLSAALLPWGLAFAAGAMLFVVSHEVIPESHRQGHEGHATTGLLIGFVLMMVLDTALG